MTKAERIMRLHAQGKTTREIADAMYRVKNATHAERDRRMAYIRVVVRQRKGGKSSEADKRYRDMKWETDEVYREKKLARWRDHRKRWAQTPEGREYRLQYQRQYQRRRYREDAEYRAKKQAHFADLKARKKAEPAKSLELA